MSEEAKEFKEKVRLLLVRNFWLFSIILISVVALVVNFVMAARIDDILLKSYSDVSASTIRLFVSSKLTKQDFTKPLSAQRYKEIDSLFDNHAEETNILKIKLWNRKGQVIYSSDKSIVGKIFPVKHELEEALEGTPEAEIVDTSEAAENKYDKKDFSRAVETYIPIRPPDSKQIEGSYEAYLDIAPLTEAANHEKVVVISGIIALYILLLTIIRLASSMLIKQNRKLEEFSSLMREKALTDDLTNLYNRRFFDPRLEEELHRATRYARPLSIIMIDIDLFKLVNDQLGHQIGDEVLSTTAALIKANLRRVDIACRLGGDEFAIIMPETEGENAMVVAERLRNAYMTILKHYRGENLPLTISTGVAEYPTSARFSKEIIAAADKALYHAKNKGRNKSSYFNDLAKKVKAG